MGRLGLPEKGAFEQKEEREGALGPRVGVEWRCGGSLSGRVLLEVLRRVVPTVLSEAGEARWLEGESPRGSGGRVAGGSVRGGSCGPWEPVTQAVVRILSFSLE